MEDSPSPEPDNLIHSLTEFLGENHDLLRLAPLVQKALAAYQYTRRKRLQAFLAAIDYEITKKGEKARRKLHDVLESEAGAEILTDFADAAIRSSSRIVRAALAVLYTDTEFKTYPKEFRARACQALDGLPDGEATFYLAITEIGPGDEAAGEHPTYPLYSFDNIVQRRPEIGRLAATPMAAATLVGDLQNRGLLLRDFSSRFGGAPGSSGITFGLPDDTALYRRLLLRAAAILPYTDPTDGASAA